MAFREPFLGSIAEKWPKVCTPLHTKVQRFLVCADRLPLPRVHTWLARQNTPVATVPPTKTRLSGSSVQARRIREVWRRSYVGMVGAALLLLALRGSAPSE